MKSAVSWIALSACLLLAGVARADLTIVQKIEGLGQPGEITIKIKADKVRMELSPQVTMIFDGKTGEMTSLMNDEKKAVRISADKMKAAAEMIKKFSPPKEHADKPKFVATGHRENVNGYETEQYNYDGPDFKAIYWIALNYPNGAEILKQLQSIQSDAWSAANTKLPDYNDLPGIPLRSHMVLKTGDPSGQGNEITTTISSIKADPLSDAEFAAPADFTELKMPDILGGKHAPPAKSPSP